MFLNSGGHKNFMPFKKKEEVVKAPADVKPAAKAEAKSAAKVEAKPAPKAEAPVVEKPKDLAYVSLRHVDKIYDNNVQAVFDFNLDIKKKEFIVFVGPSGCGKSTTLRMIAGLEDISHGELWIDGEYSTDRTPKDRDIAMVFQSYALYPHMTVYNNMYFCAPLYTNPEVVTGTPYLTFNKVEIVDLGDGTYKFNLYAAETEKLSNSDGLFATAVISAIGTTAIPVIAAYLA